MKLMIELMSAMKGFEDIEASKTLSKNDKGAMIWEMFRTFLCRCTSVSFHIQFVLLRTYH